MSKSNLDHVGPNIFELAELSWESSGNKQDGWYCQDEEHVRKIFRKLADIPTSWKELEDVTIYTHKIQTNWQMRSEIPILPESRAELDETVIPFWAGVKPPKHTWRTRLADWLTR